MEKLVDFEHSEILVARERMEILERWALKRPHEEKSEGLDKEAGPSTAQKLRFDAEHDFNLEAPAEPEHALNPTLGLDEGTGTSTPQKVFFVAEHDFKMEEPFDAEHDFKWEEPEYALNPTHECELAMRVRALEEKLEANTKVLEANTRQLAESTLQVSKLTTWLQFLLKEKAKDVAVEVSFPVPNEEALAELEFKIGPGTKEAYTYTITNILRGNSLSKSLKSVLAESLICDFNLEGVNGKKSLKLFPEFFSVLIDSINLLDCKLPAEKALAHAISCAKNNANKKRKHKENYLL